MRKRILDVGCGSDPDRWFPGADLCEINGEGLEEIEFADMCNSKSPLPVPDGSYDLIWYSYGWQWVDPHSYKGVAEEMSRIAAPRATIIIKDYCTLYDWDKDVEVDITPKEWKDNLLKYFQPLGWVIESFWVTEEFDPSKLDGSSEILCILSRNWG